MAASKGDKFWKLRSKYDKESILSSSQKLKEAAQEYFEWCEKHPLYRQEAVKSGSECGRIIDIPIRRPYSLSGLCSFIQCSQSYYYRFKKKCTDEFKDTLENIEDIIETQQFEGAVVGIFNTSIIARKLGLREQTDITTNGEKASFKIEVIDNKTKLELEELKKRLETKTQ